MKNMKLKRYTHKHKLEGFVYVPTLRPAHWSEPLQSRHTPGMRFDESCLRYLEKENIAPMLVPADESRAEFLSQYTTSSSKLH